MKGIEENKIKPNIKITLMYFSVPSRVCLVLLKLLTALLRCLFVCFYVQCGVQAGVLFAPPDCSFAGNIYEDKPLSLFLHFTLGQEFTFSIIAGPSDLTSEKSFGPDKNVC